MRGRIVWILPERTRTSFFGEFEQDVRSQNQRRAAVGGEYAIASGTRLYARHERLSAVDGPYAINQAHDQAYTVFGVDGDYLQNTQMFSEYRARDAFAGRDVEASIGLRNRWGVSPGLNISTSVERVSPLVVSGDNQSTLAGKAFAVTGAVEWTRSQTFKSTARVEVRNASSGDNRLYSAGFARKLNRDFTLLTRTLWDDFDAARRETRGFTQAGLAWRETRDNRWNALARYEHRYEHLGALALTGATRDVAHVGAAIVNYQAMPRLTFSGRYAAKYATNRTGLDQTANTAQLVMGRGVFDLSSRLDAGLITSVLFGGGPANRKYGLGGEAGVLSCAMSAWRAATTSSVSPTATSARSARRAGRVRQLRFKFDEGLFGLGAVEGGETRILTAAAQWRRLGTLQADPCHAIHTIAHRAAGPRANRPRRSDTNELCPGSCCELPPALLAYHRTGGESVLISRGYPWRSSHLLRRRRFGRHLEDDGWGRELGANLRCAARAVHRLARDCEVRPEHRLGGYG
jgi:hypothetical protein